jgi:hypothetical protein
MLERVHLKALRSEAPFLDEKDAGRLSSDILISTGSGPGSWAVVGDWEAGRFLLPEIDLCGGPLTWGAVFSTRMKTWLSTMTLCPARSAAEGCSLKRGLLSPHGRIRRGPEGSSRKVDVRRRQDPRVEKTTKTPYLEGMPITTDATTVHPVPRTMRGLLTPNQYDIYDRPG